MTDLQERNKKILTRCGVGAKEQNNKEEEIILDSRSSGFGSFTGFQDEFSRNCQAHHMGSGLKTLTQSVAVLDSAQRGGTSLERLFIFFF